METTLSATSTISKTLNSNSIPFISHLHFHFSTTRSSQCLQSRLAFLPPRRTLSREFHRSSKFISISPSSLRSLGAWAVVSPVRCRLGCVSSSAASFASGGGGGIGGSDSGGDGSGGGDGAPDGEVKANPVPRVADDVSALSSDVIILDVGGMTCGGCAASVKRILESQLQVSTASVNLTTETAIVLPTSEAKVAQNWQKNLGNALAKHLTTCGFKSNFRGQADTEGEIPS